MLRHSLQSCVIVLLVFQIGLAQDPLKEFKKESSEQVNQLRNLAAKHSGKDVIKPAAILQLDILIACVIFDEKGELRLKREDAEPEVNRAGTIGTNLAAKLNEQQAKLPPEVIPGAAGANFLLEGLAGEDKLQSLEQLSFRLAADGSEARVQYANRMPRIVGTSISQRGTSNTVEMENVGVIVAGSAQITKTGKIAISVELERSAFGPEEESTVISVQGDTTIRTPRIDIMTLETQVAFSDGESIALGSTVRSWGDKVTETFVIATATVVKPE